MTFELRLMSYLERDLDAATRAAMDQHRVDCARCDALVRDLESVAEQARALPPLAPPRDLWEGINARLETPVIPIATAPVIGARAPRRSVSLRVFAIAATVLIAVSSTITWQLTRSDSVADSTAVAATSAGTAVVPVMNVDVVYEREIAALRTIVNERFAELDSATVSVLRSNLEIIDRAIEDSRAALEKDPASRVLSTTLDRALESKLQLMRRVALL